MNKYLSLRIPPSYRAFGTSIFLHLLLLILLLGGIYVTQYRQSDVFASEDEAADNAASIMFVDDPADKPTDNRQESAGVKTMADRDAREEPTRAHMVPQEPLPEPVPEPQEQAVEHAYRPTIRRRSAEEARNAWRKPQTTHEQIQEEQTEPQLNARQRFGKALHTALYEQQEERARRLSGGRELTRNGKESALAQRINGEFSQDVMKNYQAAIARAICYELNKQRIMATPSSLPDVIILRIVLARDGTLLEDELLRGSPTSQEFNQKLLSALRAAAPYRKAPSQLKEEPFSFTFRIYPTDSMLHDKTTREKIPINFYLNDKGVY